MDHDRGLIPLAQSYIKPGSIVIDVGAFIGDHTIAYLESAGPNGIVVAYEPNPVAHECLRRNCPKAVSFQCAVLDRVGQTQLKIQEGNIGASYLDPSADLRVNCTTLDNDFAEILSPLGWHTISLIKIDAEGCEPEILKGAKNIISQYRPVIIAEINGEVLQRRGHTNLELFDFMTRSDYRPEFWPPSFGWSDPNDRCDVVFIPE